ncbi:MAG: hypothetical protein HQM08_17125 [Candidatus Riflebacteria bacterium]|nr:hypothetical protein [Candidatus Riflebacteria bacterium]
MESPKEGPATSTSELYEKETHCPSCGRFVGIYTRCPYCQTLTQKRLSIRVFKIFSIVTSTLGLLILLFYAKTIQTPEVKIESLGPLSNFAHVKIVGEVEKSFGIHPQWKSLAFTLKQDDEKGHPINIRVTAYAKVAQDIEKLGIIPQDGDQVSVEGQVRFQKDSPSLLINASAHLKILSHGAGQAPDGSENLTLDPKKVDFPVLGKTVTVRGKAIDVVGYPSGLMIRLDNSQDGLIIWIPSKIADQDNINAQVGDTLEFKGLVKKYKETIEVEVNAPGNAKVISSGAVSTAQTTENSSSTPSISNTKDEKSQSQSQIQTQVKSPEQSSASVKFPSQGTTQRQGSEVELRPYFQIASLSNEQIDKEVRIIGVLKKIESFKTGTRLLVKDDSGEIQVWLENEVASNILIPSEGAKISVEGLVALFKSKIQIQPVSPEDFSVLP